MKKTPEQRFWPKVHVRGPNECWSWMASRLPGHLEVVTQQENLLASPNNLAAIHSSRESCPQGHPYRGRNLRITQAGTRKCKECEKIRAREIRARKRRAA